MNNPQSAIPNPQSPISNPKSFDQQIEAAFQRLEALEQQVREADDVSPEPHGTLRLELLAELAIALEELQVAGEELHAQNEALATAQQSLEAERRRYQDLFEFAPDGYLVTDAGGVIEEANDTAASLFNREQKFLGGKPLVLFVAGPDRATFHTHLTRLQAATGERPEVWELSLQPYQRPPFPAALTVAAMPDAEGRPVTLRWLIHDITRRKQAEQALQRYNRRLKILHKLDEVILAAHPLESIAQIALDNLQALVPYDRASVILYDLEARQATLLTAQTVSQSRLWPGPASRPLAMFRALQDLQRGQVRRVENMLALPHPSQVEQILIGEGIRSYLSIPLLARDELFGALNLGWKQPGPFAPEHIEIGQEIAEQLAVAIQQARLHQQIQRHTVELEQRVAEQTAELRQERNFMAAILETAGALVVVLDREGRIVQVNRAWEQLTGYTTAERRGKQVWDLLLPEEIEPAKAVFEQLRAGHFPNTYENHLVTKAGYRRLIAWSNTVLLDAAGEVEYIIGTGLDITARKQAEEEIEHAHRWLERIAQTTPDIIFVLDIANNRNVYTNRSILEILGYSPEEFGQLPDILQKAVHPDDLHQVEGFYRAMAGAKPGQVRLLTHRALHKDGTIRWIESRVAPFTWDEAGRLREVIGLAHDITERKRMEEALKTHGRILDNMAEGVLVAGEDNIIYLTNPAFEAMFGYEPGELSGQNTAVLNLDPIRTTTRFTTEIIPALQSAEVWSGELNNRKKDGSPFITSARISRLEMPDQTFLISVQEDITERKQLELEQAQLFEEVSRQRAQLRVLTGRLVETQEAERKAIARELHDQVGQNLTALDLNLNIIQGQLAEAWPQAGAAVQGYLKDSLALVEHVGARIRDIMADLRPPILDDYGLAAALRGYGSQLASRTDLAITVQADEPASRLPALVELTLLRIAQEALTNVARHAQASQVTIRLESDNSSIRLIIADDGLGFEIEAGSDPGRRQRWGLITMAERAEAVGGRCRVESQPGQGTQVIVEIPRPDR